MAPTDTSFRSKIFTSVKLSGLQFMSEVGLRLISTVVLTRLLAPEIYGVFAIVLVYMYLLEMFSDLGIRSLILTKEGRLEPDFLRTCWTVSIIRGLFILAVSGIIAGIIYYLQTRAAFGPDNPYAAPALPLAIAALGGTSAIYGLMSPLRFVAEREMTFGRITIVDVCTNVVSLVVTIVLAYYLRSVWALVLGSLTKNLFAVALSFKVFPGTQMRLRLNRADLGIVIDRGKWILGQSMLTALSQSADRLMLGFLMSSSSFGFYFIARQIFEIFVVLMEKVNAQISLQVFTHIQKSTVENFRNNYYRYRLVFDVVAGLCAGGMLVLAPLFVDIVFDDRYRGIADMLQIIILALLLTGPLLLRQAFMAEHRFKDVAFLGVVSLAVLWPGLLLAIFVFGSETLALFVIALHRVPEAIILTLMAKRRDWIDLRREYLMLVFFGVGAVLGWVVLKIAGLIL